MQARKDGNAQGVDVSHYQGQVDWLKVHAAGYSFAIMKTTEGQHMTDDTLADNLAGAKAAGMAVGTYHFCRASNVADAVAEARFYLSVLAQVGGINSLDIPPILDIETVNAHTTDEVTAIANAWLEEIEAATGVQPMFYSFPWFADEYLQSSLAKYKMWLADYQNNPPADHCGCSEWTFLQYTDKGQVPGIGGPVDLNEYNGEAWKLLYKMPVEIADEFIEECQLRYKQSKSQEDKDAWHNKANALRMASGRPPAPPE